jgi:hypothetical protein
MTSDIITLHCPLMRLKDSRPITEHIDPALGIATNGRVSSLEEAKARFELSWSKVREAQEQQRQE